jgi:hypothetical protein
VADDVLEEERPSGPQGLRHLTDSRAHIGEVMSGDPAGDDIERVVERQRFHVTGGEGDVGGAALGREAPGRIQHRCGEVIPDHQLGEGGKGEGGVAAPRGHVQDPSRPEGSAPRDQRVQVGAAGMSRARNIVSRASSELFLHQPRVAFGHDRGRVARWR